jgi:hypothetical protein
VRCNATRRGAGRGRRTRVESNGVLLDAPVEPAVLVQVGGGAEHVGGNGADGGEGEGALLRIVVGGETREEGAQVEGEVLVAAK